MQTYFGIRHYPTRRIGRTLALTLLALILGTAQADHGNWRFQYLTNPDGVWVNEVVSLAQDEEGAIWAATWGEGLQRIHEATWETYSERTGFVGDWQSVVIQDVLGGIWVGTADGLCHIQGATQSNLTSENTPLLDDHEIRVIRNHANGDLLLGTESGSIYRCPRELLSKAHPQAWERVVGPNETGGHPIHDLLAIPGGSLWVSLTFHGLAEWTGTTWKEANPPLPKHSFRFASFEDEEERYWAAHCYAGTTMLRYDQGEWMESFSIDQGVGGFATSSEGTRYIATTAGLQRLEGDTWHTVDLGGEIGTPNIRAILIEEDDTIWLGCQEGLIRGTRNSWAIAEKDEELAPLVTILPWKDKDAPVYGLDTHQHLVELNAPTPTTRLNLQAAGPGKIKSLTAPLGDRLWAIRSTGETVALSLEDGRILDRIPQPEALNAIDAPYMVLFQGQSGALFLHSDAGLHQRQSGQWVPVPFVEPGRSWNRVLAMDEGPDGTYYIGGRDGLFQWDGGDRAIDLREVYQIASKDSVYAILYRPSGELWFGTHGSGLFRVSDGEVRQFTRKEGLRSDMISGLYATGDDTVWVAYRRQGLGMYHNGHWLNYGYPQGLHNTFINRLLEQENGDIWAFDAEGNRYDYHPDRFAPNARILVGTERIDVKGRAVFSFQGWDGWDHTPPKSLRFATHVTTADGAEVTPWSPFLETTSWVAPPLPPGRYEFAVRASDEDGNIDPTPATVFFTVSPPLWLRPQFSIPLIAAALFSMIMLISRYQNFRQLKHSQQVITRSNHALQKEVDERAKTERALRESEARLVESQVLARLGSWTLDIRRGDGSWSREMYRLFDRDPSKGPPNLNDFLDMLHPDDRDDLMQKQRELVRDGQPFEHVFRSNPARGAVVHYLARVKANVDKDGTVHSISGATQDISAQIQAKEEHEALEEKLRQSQKLEALGQLTGGIAHDFNNILHALLGFCSLAQIAAPDDRATVTECLKDIEIAAKRAAALVRQLLTFSRREQMQRSPITLAPLVEEGLKLVRSTLPATIEIRHTYRGKDHMVFADPTQIHQIVLNLCTNAAHAMPKGGVLEVSCTKVAFHRPTLMNTGELTPGDYIRLSIADTGTGISPDVAACIFDPFFTTKETGSGTGLGLTTVHGIVVSMKGAINVETVLGTGTTFHVYMKQCTDPVESLSLSPAPEEGPVQTPFSGRILLVDDEEAIVKLAQRAISGRGLSVDAFNHPTEALATFIENPDDYAILVTDLTMPKLTGFELAKRIRAIRPDLPVLLLSGHLENKDFPTALVTKVLRKPINLSQLITAIERYGSPPSNTD